jgi:glucose-fructose oxidoreductase
MKSSSNPSYRVSRRRFLGQLTAAAAVAVMPRWSRAQDGPAPSRKLGIALAGLGNYSEYHLAPALRVTNYCKLAGVVTGTRAKGEQWARDYGFSERNIFSYDTMAQMAGNPDIDMVYVVTPNGLHAEHCIAAARAGKHVICEKPMANTVAECDAIIAACRAAGVRLTVGYRLHYEPHHVEFERLAREKVFGPFTRMEGANGFRMGVRPGAPLPWRLNKRLAGGGPLMDMGVYVIQAACMARVEETPAAIVAEFDPVTRPDLFSEVEEGVRWTMEFADGARARCRATYAEGASRFRAEGERGWAQLGPPAFSYDDPVLTTSRGRVHLPRVNHQAAQMDGMALELMEGRPSIAPGEMGRRDIAVVEAIYASAGRGGTRIPVQGSS